MSSQSFRQTLELTPTPYFIQGDQDQIQNSAFALTLFCFTYPVSFIMENMYFYYL